MASTRAVSQSIHVRGQLSVNLGNRGGHTYPDLVSQSEKKPIRISHLQDGRNDNRGPGRNGGDPNSYDWFYQNVRLADSLTKKGYDVN